MNVKLFTNSIEIYYFLPWGKLLVLFRFKAWWNIGLGMRRARGMNLNYSEWRKMASFKELGD
jgi:hypothetical protein